MVSERSPRRRVPTEEPGSWREGESPEIGRWRCHLEEDPRSGGRSRRSVSCVDMCLGGARGVTQQHQTLAAGSSSTPWSTMSFCQPSLICNSPTAPSPWDFQDRGERWIYRGSSQWNEKPKSYAQPHLLWDEEQETANLQVELCSLLTVCLRNFKQKMLPVFVLPSYSPVNL